MLSVHRNRPPPLRLVKSNAEPASIAGCFPLGISDAPATARFLDTPARLLFSFSDSIKTPALPTLTPNHLPSIDLGLSTLPVHNGNNLNEGHGSLIGVQGVLSPSISPYNQISTDAQPTTPLNYATTSMGNPYMQLTPEYSSEPSFAPAYHLSPDLNQVDPTLYDADATVRATGGISGSYNFDPGNIPPLTPSYKLPFSPDGPSARLASAPAPLLEESNSDSAGTSPGHHRRYSSLQIQDKPGGHIVNHSELDAFEILTRAIQDPLSAKPDPLAELGACPFRDSTYCAEALALEQQISKKTQLTSLKEMLALPKRWRNANRPHRGTLKCRIANCEDKFRTSAMLAAHADLVHGETFALTRNYRCGEGSCPWSIIGFPTNSELRRHAWSQHPTTDKALYKCDGCHREFGRGDSLKRHTRTCPVMSAMRKKLPKISKKKTGSRPRGRPKKSLDAGDSRG